MTVALTAADAQVYWMSAKIPNDSFLLYAFDGDPRTSTARWPRSWGAPSAVQTWGCVSTTVSR